MAQQSLKHRKAAIVLQEFKGAKARIRAIRLRLEAEGLIEDSPEAFEAWKDEQARKLIQEVRTFDDLEGTGKVEMVSLFEFTEDGFKVEYYKHKLECNLDESVQFLTYWYKRIQGDSRQFHRHFKDLSAIHGRKKLQRKLPFDIPADPDAKPVGV
jgi:hypothetical protein